MLITFKSKAAAEIIMYQSHIAPVLERLGKKVELGVITAEETSAAILTIETLIAQENQTKDALPNQIDERDLDEFDKKTLNDTVRLSTRLYPFLEMLRAAQKKQTDVLWGV